MDLGDIAKFAAEEAAEKYNRTVVVEDSGLFVKALNGFPGPYSSYVHATIGVEGLVRLMSQKQGGSEFKDRYSHRAIAFRKLALWYIKTKV